MENNAGRPEYKKTDEDAKNVEALTIAGVPQKLVSKILKISEPEDFSYRLYSNEDIKVYVWLK